MTAENILLTILVMAAITLATRALPFLFMENFKHHKIILYLGSVLPASVIFILFFYSLNIPSFVEYPYGIPAVVASIILIPVHVYKRNVFVSIVIGTVIYVLLQYFMSVIV